MSRETAPAVAGINPVIASLKADPAAIDTVFLAAGSTNQRLRDIEMLARDAGVDVRRVPRESLERMVDMERHQDVVAVLHARAPLHEEDLDRLLDALTEPALLLVLDGVQDPHNLGACLRTAEAAGVHAVIVPKDRAVGLTPVVRKAAAGAADLVPLVQVTNLARVLRAIKERGIWVYGTSDQADNTLWEQDLRGAVALVMGGEGDGLRRLTVDLCDHLVSIPMAGRVESLNVSVATGVCLYEIRRQRQAG